TGRALAGRGRAPRPSHRNEQLARACFRTSSCWSTSAGDGVSSDRGGGGVRHHNGSEPVEVTRELPMDTRAPGIARRCLAPLEPIVPQTALQDVALITSELVTNSLMHSGMGATGRIHLVVRVIEDGVRIE